MFKLTNKLLSYLMQLYLHFKFNLSTKNSEIVLILWAVKPTKKKAFFLLSFRSHELFSSSIAMEKRRFNIT